MSRIIGLAQDRIRQAPSPRMFFGSLILLMALLIPVGSVRYRLGSVSNVTERGAVSGRVLYDDGRPAISVPIGTMMLTWLMGKKAPQIPLTLDRKQTTTGVDGRYEIADLPAGLYGVIPPEELGTWVDHGGRNVSVAANEISPVKDIRLTSGSRILGQVVDADSGQPLQGIWIGCGGPRVVGPGMPIWSGSPITDKDGQFSVSPPPGRTCLYLAGLSSTVDVNLNFMGSGFSHRALDVIKVGDAMYATSEWVQVMEDGRAPFYQRIGPSNDALVIETNQGQTYHLVLRLKRLSILAGNRVILGDKPRSHP